MARGFFLGLLTLWPLGVNNTLLGTGNLPQLTWRFSLCLAVLKTRDLRAWKWLSHASRVFKIGLWSQWVEMLVKGNSVLPPCISDDWNVRQRDLNTCPETKLTWFMFLDNRNLSLITELCINKDVPWLLGCKIPAITMTWLNPSLAYWLELKTVSSPHRVKSVFTAQILTTVFYEFSQIHASKIIRLCLALCKVLLCFSPPRSTFRLLLSWFFFKWF